MRTDKSNLGPSRTRVLALLQEAGRPLTAQEVGDQLDMHPNSVRFHLEALAADGDVARDRARRSTPGRPSVTYAATPAAPAVARRRYRLLAGMLAGLLREHLGVPAADAEYAGRRWSQSLPLTGGRAGGVTEQDALDVLTGSLDDLGFDSRAVDGDDGLRVEVTHCPFLEVATEHEDVVCGLHLGLMRGVLERLDTPLVVRSLEPRVAPGLCLARLSR